jgi:hypothetical protein
MRTPKGRDDAVLSRRYLIEQEGVTDPVVVNSPPDTTFREINGFDREKKNRNCSWNRLPDEIKIGLKRIFSRDMLDISASLREREIDHRMPEDTRRFVRAIPIPLTLASLEDRTWIDSYQVISTAANDIKRQRCAVCQSGAPIELPQMLHSFSQAYIATINRDRKEHACLGCAWFDELRPARVLSDAHATGLIAALCEQEKKLDQVCELVKAWRARTKKHGR